MQIELWDLENFLGLIVPGPTGVRWTNQVAGSTCFHPVIEGTYIPLPDWSPADPETEDPFFDWMTKSYDPVDVAEFIRNNGSLAENFEPLSEEEFTALHQRVAEAWVPVKVKATPTLPQLIPVAGKPGILTYANSD